MLFDDFRKLVINNTPLIDLRAPVEFKKGAFPTAINLPLMSDKEREEVGICYKERGNQEAVKLGHKLVSGEVKQERIDSWIEFIKANEDAMIYCFRGGQRSKIAQEWLKQSGYKVPRLKGGYKAFRSYLMSELDRSTSSFKPILLGGYTGSGKSLLLDKIENKIDLEALAKHRGSAFGRDIVPQPSQIDFENSLVFELIQKIDRGYKSLIFEDEGKNIGRLYLPIRFYNGIKDSDMIILHTPLSKRVEITFDEYVLKAQEKYIKSFEDEGLDRWIESIKLSLERIKKRLGSQRYIEINKLIDEAMSIQIRDKKLDGHKRWVKRLLVEYYDPMYEYQLKNKSNKIIFRGDDSEVLGFVKEL